MSIELGWLVLGFTALCGIVWGAMTYAEVRRARRRERLRRLQGAAWVPRIQR